MFHICNYMRETNTWMIRKMRWILWCTFGFIPAYRNFYWDFLGRRVAWKDSMSGKTDADRQAEAVAARADWGYHPRYEGKLNFSIKTRKQAEQTEEEAMRDIPRVRLHDTKDKLAGYMKHSDVQTLIMIAREHNRTPGTFDYSFPQTFYSTFPDIDQETYVTLGSHQKRRVHME